MKTPVLLFIVALLFAPSAGAQERWSRHNEPGNFLYEKDIGTKGVITYPIGRTGLRGAMYLEGLAGNADQRERFIGYWTEPPRENTPSCGVSVVDAQGLTTDYWGRICFDEPDTQIVATPVEAE